MVAAAMFALLSVASVSGAQEGRAGRGARADAQRGAGRAAGQQPLVRELRQRFALVVRRQLNLSDENAKKLENADRKFERQRTALRRDEREARQGLRAALADTTIADDAKQAKIAQYMDRLTGAQRRRADILEAEQKELATFLTPVQRAKLQGLREQLVQRVNQIQRQNGGGRKGIEP
jgi:hypothetical protein